MKVLLLVLVAVGAGLVLTSPALHRRFGIWSLGKMRGCFRPAGVVSLVFGGLIFYAVPA